MDTNTDKWRERWRIMRETDKHEEGRGRDKDNEWNAWNKLDDNGGNRRKYGWKWRNEEKEEIKREMDKKDEEKGELEING